jgi:hypothetical protein
MVLPEQFHHNNPTEEALLIDIIRQRGGLTRYCQNTETQVATISQVPSNCRKSYMDAKLGIRR